MICVYILTHRKTGMIYYGSTCDYDRRQKQHLYNLNKGNHVNKKLQEVYNIDKDLEWKYLEVGDIETARFLEEGFIKQNIGNPQLLNRLGTGCLLSDDMIEKLRNVHLGKPKTLEARKKMSISKTGMGHTEETKKKMSLTRMGKKQSAKWVENRAKHKRKIVMGDGVEYPSLAEAAKKNNIAIQTALDRINSKTERFINWYYK